MSTLRNNRIGPKTLICNNERGELIASYKWAIGVENGTISQPHPLKRVPRESNPGPNNMELTLTANQHEAKHYGMMSIHYPNIHLFPTLLRHYILKQYSIDMVTCYIATD
jgi:hypothetical protein